VGVISANIAFLEPTADIKLFESIVLVYHQQTDLLSAINSSFVFAEGYQSSSESMTLIIGVNCKSLEGVNSGRT